MKVAAFVQGYAHGRGRATTALEQISELGERGHDVTVFLPGARGYVDTPGVTVKTLAQHEPGERYDVVVFNSGLSLPMTRAVRASHGAKFLCQHSYNIRDVGLKIAETVWYPSRACSGADHGRSYRKFTCPPPINPDRYKVRPGDAVGAVSTAPAKGGDVVAALARRMPRHRFVVVQDPAGQGVAQFAGLKNVQLLPFADPAQFYSKCRILLFPSVTESYGRAPVEAAVSGIPTIASPLNAVKEALRGRGIFIPRQKIGMWARETENLMRYPAAWQAASARARNRGANLDYEGSRDRWAAEVERLGRGGR